MIAALRGSVLHKDTQGVVVECAGVGYGVAMSLRGLNSVGAVGEPVSLLVHTHVSDDALRLFGFVEALERRVFEVLIQTSGVGPKLALAMLSTLGARGVVDAVEQGDKILLTSISGVGPKKAARLLVDLKGRFQLDVASFGSTVGPASRSADVVSALLNLGFGRQDAERAAEHAFEVLPGIHDVAALVREALRSTTKH